MTFDAKTALERIQQAIADDFDEELEMEMDDQRLENMLADMEDHPEREQLDRRVYFKELFRLQSELVKLQDWVQSQKLKVVVIFEGRDSAGKGGVIKRITQRLNPRICRVAALPAPTSASASMVLSALRGSTCPRPAKWCCSTAAGTIAPASSASWASAPRR
jgi:polyphosphate kinase 2 (PPK2 family)